MRPQKLHGKVYSNSWLNNFLDTEVTFQIYQHIKNPLLLKSYIYYPVYNVQILSSFATHKSKNVYVSIYFSVLTQLSNSKMLKCISKYWKGDNCLRLLLHRDDSPLYSYNCCKCKAWSICMFFTLQ